MSGQFYIISAPSGAGKTSLVQQLVTSLPGLEVSVSYTTRLARPNEVDGRNYHFISDDRFNQLMASDEFLEHAKVFDHHYATSKSWVSDKLQAGIDVILEIDWQGAEQVWRQFPAAIGIFILPPSYEVLKQRLLDRNQDDRAVVDRRMQAARDEVSHYGQYKYLILNDDFDESLINLRSIIRAERVLSASRSEQMQVTLQKLLA